MGNLEEMYDEIMDSGEKPKAYFQQENDEEVYKFLMADPVPGLLDMAYIIAFRNKNERYRTGFRISFPSGNNIVGEQEGTKEEMDEVINKTLVALEDQAMLTFYDVRQEYVQFQKDMIDAPEGVVIETDHFRGIKAPQGIIKDDK